MSDITYVVDRVRVKVKAIGALTAADAHVVHSCRREPTESPGDSTPTDAQPDSKADLSKVWHCVCVCVHMYVLFFHLHLYIYDTYHQNWHNCWNLSASTYFKT